MNGNMHKFEFSFVDFSENHMKKNENPLNLDCNLATVSSGINLEIYWSMKVKK